MADKRTGAAYDTMARNDDRNGVPVIRHVHDPTGLQVADGFDDIFITHRIGIGNRVQDPPSLLHGRYSLIKPQRQVKHFAPTGEIRLQLRKHLAQQRRFWTFRNGITSARQIKMRDGTLFVLYAHPPEGGFPKMQYISSLVTPA